MFQTTWSLAEINKKKKERADMAAMQALYLHKRPQRCMLAGNTAVASVVETLTLPFGIGTGRLSLTLHGLCLGRLGLHLGYLHLPLSNSLSLSLSLSLSVVVSGEMPMTEGSM